MKRAIVLVLAVALLLVGCGGEKDSASIVAKDGAYNLTPQQLIDGMNAYIEDLGDSRYQSIPDYVASGDAIEVVFLDFTIYLYANDDGYLTKIEMKASNSSGKYQVALNTFWSTSSLLVHSIVPGESGEEIWNKLDIDGYGGEAFTTTAQSNGTQFTYNQLGSSSTSTTFRRLTIEPLSE